MARHCRDTWWLGTAGILGGEALQGYLVVGHCRDTLRLGTAGTLGGWATAGMLGGGHCNDALRLGTAVRLRAEGEDNMDFKITPLRGWGINS